MLLTGVTFFIILSLLVLIHEMGHFLVARFVGVGVEEFGLGLPPRIWGKKIKGTIYSINWLPIGGFVKLAGEDEGAPSSELRAQNLKQLFWLRSKKERAAILVAGVAMNFLLAVGLTTYLLSQGVLEPSGRVHVEQVMAGSPAEKAGIRVGDIIVKFKVAVEERELRTVKELIETTKAHAGKAVSLTLGRDGKEVIVSLIPREEVPQGQGPMGVAISDLETKTYSWMAAPGKAFEINIDRARFMLASLAIVFWRLVTLQPLEAEVAGPIGIAQVTGQAVKYGLRAILEFMSILSLNLAVLNIIPFPALDGGRLTFVFIEKFIGRRIRPAFERSAHQFGMIVLFSLILLVTINDILRLTRGN